MVLTVLVSTLLRGAKDQGIFGERGLRGGKV